jgi:hypothetical protein
VQSIIKELFGSASPFCPSLSIDGVLSEAHDSLTSSESALTKNG